MRKFNLMVSVLMVAFSCAASTAWGVPMTAGNGPGGFVQADGASALRLWLDAGKGVFTHDGLGGVGPLATGGQSVRQWQDQSGYVAHASQATVASQPLYVTNVKNNQPAIRFDGSNDVFNTLAPNNSNITVIVAYANRTATNGSLYSTPAPNDPIQRNTSYWPDSSSGSGGLSQGMNDNNLMTMQYNYTAGNYVVRLDALQVGTISGVKVFNTGNLFVGARSGNSEWLNGDVTEMVVFHGPVNAAQRTIAEHSLAAKYDINLDGTLLYDGGSLSKGHYDLEVFGIGRVDASNEVTIAGNAGLQIEVTGGTLGSGDFVLAGHKMVTNTMSQDGTWSRVWYLDTNGGVDTADLTLTFDSDDAGGMFYSPQGQFSLLFSDTDGGPFTTLSVFGDVDGGRVAYEFVAGTLQDGYYTLNWSPFPVPEPSTFGLLMFGATAGLMRKRRSR